VKCIRLQLLLAAAVLALGVPGAGPALARDLTVTLDPLPPEVAVGVPLRVGFTILAAPDGQPVPGLTPLIVARQRGRLHVMTLARPQSPGGHYQATLILPAAGVWQWEVHPSGQLDAAGIPFSPLLVHDPTAAADPPRALWWLLALAGGLALLILALAQVGERSRDRRYVPAPEVTRLPR
jgi:hypothetical protein